jgi:septum formation protein
MSLRHRLATTCQIESSEDGTRNEGGTIRLVLASQSPRRREILSMMGLEGRFDVVPSPADERAVQRQLQQHGPVAPPKYAESLARAKALALAELLKAKPGSNSIVEMTSAPAPTAVVVLGSDTIVELDGNILEKPRDESEAKEMLSRLSGRQHLVHTGVALACVKIGALSGDEVATRSFVDTAVIQFAALMPEDIDSYVSTGEPMDKAGSYGIQGMGGQMVESITGDFFTVRFRDMEPACQPQPTSCQQTHRHLCFPFSFPPGNGLAHVPSQPRTGTHSRGTSTMRCRRSVAKSIMISAFLE